LWINLRDGSTGNQPGRITKLRKQLLKQVMFPRTGAAPFSNDGFRIA